MTDSVRLQRASLAVLVVVLCAPITIRAQEFEASNIYTAPSIPPILHAHASMRAPVQAPRAHSWFTLNKISIAVLAAGEAVDSWGTYRNMTHTKWICGNSPAFDGAYDTNVPGQISSLRDVQSVCGVGPAGQSANWAFDVTRVGYFSEGGWVTQFHLADRRNYAGVEAWNLVNDVGWYLVARRLGKRTDWIGKWGRSALNFERGIVHFDLGIGNFVAVSRDRNPNTLDLYIPKNSNYTAPRWWGKH